MAGQLCVGDQASWVMSGSPPSYAAGSAGSYWPYACTDLGGKDEHRQWPRRPLHCSMLLIDPLSDDDRSFIPGECLNIGDGGLYGTVPLGYGVALGQRYTFRLMVGERGPEPGAIQVVSQQGLIVRTELLVGRDGGEDRLGIAVRLSGHRSGVIPMPT